MATFVAAKDEKEAEELANEIFEALDGLRLYGCRIQRGIGKTKDDLKIYYDQRFLGKWLAEDIITRRRFNEGRKWDEIRRPN